MVSSVDIIQLYHFNNESEVGHTQINVMQVLSMGINDTCTCSSNIVISGDIE